MVFDPGSSIFDRLLGTRNSGLGTFFLKMRYRFGQFELDSERRLLIKDGRSVTLYAKAFDLLCELVANGGEVVGKDHLLSRVWPEQFVEENNLSVHISALRKALGGNGQVIATVSGRGYSFVAPVETVDDPRTEVVIEQRTIERITVEESASDPPQQLTSGRRGGFGHLVPVAIAAGFLVLILGGYFWRERAGASFSSSFAGADVKQLTTSGKVQIAALSPDGKMFAYVVDEATRRSLWLGFVNGGNPLQLRTASADTEYFDLAFDPDSARLYFSCKDDKMIAPALSRMPVSGGVPEKIADGIDNFSLSPDGQKIVYGRREGEKDRLIVSSPDGANLREIASFRKAKSFVFDSISWSPDGKRLALSKVREDRPLRSDLALVSIADGAIEILRDDSWREILKTAWLKDSSGIVVSAIKGDAWASIPKYNLFQVDLHSGKTKALTHDLSSYVSSLNLPASGDAILTIVHRQLTNIWIAPADDLSGARAITFSAFGKYDGYGGMDFTPDGKILYTNSDTESAFLSQINADGSGSKPLTAPGHIDSVLSVSGDGRYVVFHSNRNNGDFDIWRMDVDGGNPKQLTFGGKNYQPFLSADSHWVYYKSWEKDVGELRRVALDGGEPEILNDKETSWGSASPDGKYLAASLITDKRRLAIFSAATHEIVRQFDLPRTATLFPGSHWTPDSQAVIFRDAEFGYWRQNINGGEAQRLDGLPEEKLYNFAFSKDGKQFAFVRGQEIRDVVLIKNAPPGGQ